MKKLTSFFGIITVIIMIFMVSIIDSFAINEDQSLHKNETIVWTWCCDESKQTIGVNEFIICNDWGICPDGDICECCISPSQNSSHLIRAGSFNTKEKFKKVKVIDFAYLSIFRDALAFNLTLNSSSYSDESGSFIIQNSYITLVGSTKSNC